MTVLEKLRRGVELAEKGHSLHEESAQVSRALLALWPALEELSGAYARKEPIHEIYRICISVTAAFKAAQKEIEAMT